MPHTWLTRRVLPIAAVISIAASLTAAAQAGPTTAKGTKVELGHTKYGKVVMNGHHRVMYLFEKDGKDRSHCASACTADWPRVTSKNTPRAGSGVAKHHLTVIRHHQLAYYGHPLYYFEGDGGPRQANGENLKEFGARWFVVSAHGKAVKPASKPPAAKAAKVTTHMTSIGEVIAAANGHTLYTLTSDSPPTFACDSGCTSVWPPLLTTAAPTAGGDANAAKLGTVTRPNGDQQVTYNGHPLYAYTGDSAAGDVNGEGSYLDGGYWYAVSPSGDDIT